MNLTTFVVYDPETGNVLRSGVCQVEDLSQQAGAGESVVALTCPDWRKKWRVAVVDGVYTLIEVVPVLTLADRRSALLKRLAERRWQVETGGFTFQGKTVKSDAESQSKINGLMTGLALLGDSFHTAWKCAGADGWIQIDAQGARQLVTAGFAHVATCFAREDQLSKAIASAGAEDLDELASVIEAFWP